jgi:lipopolysaccharide transport system permease protein
MLAVEVPAAFASWTGMLRTTPSTIAAEPARTRDDGGASPLFVIEPSHGWVAPNLRDIWLYRELLYFLVWRDVKVRYKQTALGAAWAVLQPFMTMVVFSIFFGRLGNIPSDGIPYPIFVYTALLPWQLFAHSLTESGNSLVTNQDLLTKVYFPRLVVPLSAVLAGLVDFCIAFTVLLAMMFYYGMAPGMAILALPFFVVFACVAALSVGLWLAALNVQYRDVRYTIPFLTQFWLFVTPIAYPLSLVPESWRIVYGLNPMVGVVEGFRWALLGTGDGVGPAILVSMVVMMLLLVGGLFYFRRVEKTFADVI